VVVSPGGSEKNTGRICNFPRAALGLRAQLNGGWHRHRRNCTISAKPSAASWPFSKNAAGIEPIRKLPCFQTGTCNDELHLANERYGKQSRMLHRIQVNTKSKIPTCERAEFLQTNQSERAALVEQRAQFVSIENFSQQRAENNARLDELKSRIESQSKRLNRQGCDCEG